MHPNDLDPFLLAETVSSSAPPLWEQAMALHRQVCEKVEAHFNKGTNVHPKNRYRVYAIDQRTTSRYQPGGALGHEERVMSLATMVFTIQLEDSLGIFARPAIVCQAEISSDGHLYLHHVNWKPEGEAIKLV